MGAGFRHEALVYAGEDEFVSEATAFIRDGLEADEPTLVMVGAPKIDLLREALDGGAGRVKFADMEQVGHNPALIIPAWREFADAHAGSKRGLRGIGEPIWPERSAAELVECHRHEALLNVAFADARDFWLICPYDSQALDPTVIAEARHTHPLVAGNGGEESSRDYMGIEELSTPFADPLPPPAAEPRELRFGAGSLKAIRDFVSAEAAEAGLTAARSDDLALAVNELATNSIRHGGGEGRLLIWAEPEAMMCEVRDRGRIEQPLVGRERPSEEQLGGYGLWLANHLCDLVQVRSFAGGGVVRVHMTR